jgi:hypothetical protein
MKLSSLIIPFLVLALFLIAFLTGAGIIALNNEPSQSIYNYPGFADFNESFSNEIYQAYSDINVTEEAAASSSITTGSDGITLDSFGSSWKTMKSSAVSIGDILSDFLLYQGIVAPIVLTTIATIVSLLILLAVWKFLRQGEG